MDRNPEQNDAIEKEAMDLDALTDCHSHFGLEVFDGTLNPKP